MLESLAAALADRVDIRWAPVPAQQTESAQEQLLADLSPDERARHDRFRFEADRASYRCAHALTRRLLAEHTGRSPLSFRFVASERGRPELDDRELGGRLRFNLSHTRGLVACAVAWKRDVGVDVEHVQRRANLLRIAESVYSPQERAELAGLDDAAQRQRFFEFWTLKEAYIKAIGKGFAVPLTRVTFESRPPHDSTVHFEPPIQDDATAWRFVTHQPVAGYMLSAAARDFAGGVFHCAAW